MPSLFPQSADGTWLQPIPVFLASVFGGSAPLVVGCLDVVLIFLAAFQLLKRPREAAFAALALTFFPAHAIYMGQSSDAIFAVPFVLAWLVCVLRFLDERRPGLLIAGGLALGIGVYTQPSAPISMAMFVIVSLVALWLEGQRAPRPYVSLVVGFAAPLLLMVPWYAMHPDSYPDTMGAWAIQKAHIRFPLDGVRAFLNGNTLATRVAIYWGIFNPSFLLFRDDASVFVRMAPMLVGLGILIPIGIARLLTTSRSSIAWLLLAGLAVSPLAASTFGLTHPVDRALSMVVFLTLLGAVGLVQLLESRRQAVRLSAFALMALIPLQYFFG